MLNKYESTFGYGNWFDWFSSLAILKTKSCRVYDYRNLVCGIDYFVDRVGEQNNTRIYMTSQKRGVKVGDLILLAQGDIAGRYVIQNLDYYSSPEDMWVALLIKQGE